ncbi:hypothetical protein SAMN05216184_104137 [Georgenia satyanarayanai]|uniref:DUF3800 domain-containing protein n=1 Tax=Georgenia satyanarayanai TaxID=860221 RepID=A0A2Y9BX95_9MICO|nr:DUF3800 domain-containing protein [Georgenia satyanarayanai]PYG00198.1 hypothetical protein A8987_104137 [Georgenia satyanarayanai]SSA40442.1 hypothetical protein SAMN05216184_104137 [Georgenia satyanarayanai]
MTGRDIFVYADETGNLDYGGAGKQGASPYFGFGTAIFDGDHSVEMWDGHVLRTSLAGRGHDMANGFHAKDDLWEVRNGMFALLRTQEPRIDTTFLLKANAYPNVKAAGEMRLYKMAWYLHLKYICQNVTTTDDRLYVIVGSMGTKKRKVAAQEAVADVCNQMHRDITLCIWPAATTWGLQVADYALWAVHRRLVGGKLTNYEEDVEPLVKSIFRPWGTA